MSKKVGVILSGCGVYDGAEIHEAVITLLELDRAGAEVLCMAPDIPQLKVVNHLTNSESTVSRNVLEESARIARGNIFNIQAVDVSSLDALILPGGYGAALNTCSFAIDGPAASIDPGVQSVISEVHKAGKPIGAMCIAPAVVALALKDQGVELTIGADEGTAQGLEALGHKHVNCATGDIVVDLGKKIVSTPAYMTAGGIAEAYEGISKLVKKVLSLS